MIPKKLTLFYFCNMPKEQLDGTAEKIALYFIKRIENSPVEFFGKNFLKFNRKREIKEKSPLEKFLSVFAQKKECSFPFSALWMSTSNNQSWLLVVKGGKNETIGEGSFATVKKAIVFEVLLSKQGILLTRKNDKLYAIHSSNDTARSELMSELQKEKFIVDFCRAERKKTTGMRYYRLIEEGVPFENFLRNSSFIITISDRFIFALSIINELHRLHKLNIAHKDIKPANIILKNKKTELCDFDFAIKDRKPDVNDKQDRFGTLSYCLTHPNYYKTTFITHDIVALSRTLFLENCVCIFPKLTHQELSGYFVNFLTKTLQEERFYGPQKEKDSITLNTILAIILLEFTGKLEDFCDKKTLKERVAGIPMIASAWHREMESVSQVPSKKLAENACAFFMCAPSSESMTTETSSTSEPSAPTQQNPRP